MVNLRRTLFFFLACLGTTSANAEESKVTFNAIDPEGAIASSEGVQKTRGLKVNSAK